MLQKSNRICYIRGMNTMAVGIYFKTLRSKYDWSQQKTVNLVSERLGRGNIPFDKGILSRLENGKTWPEGDFFTALIAVLQANIVHVVALQNDEEATERYAKELAETWFDKEQLGRLDHVIANTKPDEFAAILADVRRELMRDPGLERHLRGILEGRRGREAPDSGPR